MTEQERNKQALIILQQLLSTHFYGIELEWGYKEGVTLQEIDRELWIQIAQTLPEVLACK